MKIPGISRRSHGANGALGFLDSATHTPGTATLGGQRTGLVEHFLADPDLADVVDVAAQLDLADQVLSEPERARRAAGIGRDTHRVAARVGILRFQGFGQGLDAPDEQFLEPALLRRDPLLEPVLVFAILENQAAFLEGLAHPGAHLLELKRLDDVIHRAHRQRADGGIDVGVTGDHDDRDVGVAPAHFPEEVDAVHLRHLHVGHDVGDRPRRKDRQGLDPVPRLTADESVCSHEMRQHLPQARLVVDDQAGRISHDQTRLVPSRGAGASDEVAFDLSSRRSSWESEMTRAFDDDMNVGFGTRAIHAGQRPDPLAGAIMTPVYLTSTYVQDGLGSNKGYEYARGKNPTREAFERNVAALESGRHGFAFSSGTGCLDSLMKMFRSGDHIVCGENVYGGTFRLFDRILQHYGLLFSYVDTRDPQRIQDAMTPATRAVLVETPTNPLMRITDLAAAADIAHRGGALLIVDNTFASPYFQRRADDCARRGYACSFHQRLRERLGRLDLRRPGRGPEDGEPLGAKPVDDAGGQRRFGSDDGQSDGVLAREQQQSVNVSRGHREAAGKLRDAGIPRSGQ